MAYFNSFPATIIVPWAYDIQTTFTWTNSQVAECSLCGIRINSVDDLYLMCVKTPMPSGVYAKWLRYSGQCHSPVVSYVYNGIEVKYHFLGVCDKCQVDLVSSGDIAHGM